MNVAIRPQTKPNASIMAMPPFPAYSLSEADAQKRVNVDTSKTMTTLQVRLMCGGRLIVKLNDSNTISDLRQYIRLLKPDTPPNFSLHTTFPNKEHTDDSATLKDAGLLGAAILMRPK